MLNCTPPLTPLLLNVPPPPAHQSNARNPCGCRCCNMCLIVLCHQGHFLARSFLSFSNKRQSRESKREVTGHPVHCTSPMWVLERDNYKPNVCWRETLSTGVFKRAPGRIL